MHNKVQKNIVQGFNHFILTFFSLKLKPYYFRRLTDKNKVLISYLQDRFDIKYICDVEDKTMDMYRREGQFHVKNQQNEVTHKPKMKLQWFSLIRVPINMKI